jgi:hypothetical protein
MEVELAKESSGFFGVVPFAPLTGDAAGEVPSASEVLRGAFEILSNIWWLVKID